MKREKKSADVMERAEEIADKLKECLALIEPNLEENSMKIRDAIDIATEDPLEFARAYLKYASTDSFGEFIDTCNAVYKEEGSHK